MHNYINETRKYLTYIKTSLEWSGLMTFHDFMNEQKNRTCKS